MTSARARAPRALAAILAPALAAAIALTGGCAQIITRSTVEVVPRTDATALGLGPAGTEVSSRGLAAAWKQSGDRLELRLEESRTCDAVRYIPVTRIERVHRRTAGGAMWLEYGLGAGALAGGLVGLIRPELFSQASTVTAEGQVLRDTGTGYRIGGVLTGIGVALLTAAVVDTVRTRDEVRYTDAYRRDRGGVIECRDPLVPMQGQTVELLIGPWSSIEPTNHDGGARFLLPAVEELPEPARERIVAVEAWEAAKAEAEAAAQAAEEEAQRIAAEEAAARAQKKSKSRKKTEPSTEAVDAVAAAPAVELGPRPEPMLVKAVLRIDNKRALAIDFVVPYADEAARAHEGRGAIEAGLGAGPAPGRGKGLSLKADGARRDGDE